MANGIKIKCVETGEVFDSVYRAAIKIQLSDVAIRRVLDNPDRTAGGYHWIIVGETCKSIPVKCVETGRKYKSVHEAGRMSGVAYNKILDVLNGVVRTAGGMHWERLDGVPIPSGAARKEGKGSSIPVRIRETGETFQSIKEAVEVTGFSRAYIREALDYEWVTTGGYHWEEVKDDDEN